MTKKVLISLCDFLTLHAKSGQVHMFGEACFEEDILTFFKSWLNSQPEAPQWASIEKQHEELEILQARMLEKIEQLEDCINKFKNIGSSEPAEHTDQSVQ